MYSGCIVYHFRNVFVTHKVLEHTKSIEVIVKTEVTLWWCLRHTISRPTCSHNVLLTHHLVSVPWYSTNSKCIWYCLYHALASNYVFFFFFFTFTELSNSNIQFPWFQPWNKYLVCSFFYQSFRLFRCYRNCVSLCWYSATAEIYLLIFSTEPILRCVFFSLDFLPLFSSFTFCFFSYSVECVGWSLKILLAFANMCIKTFVFVCVLMPSSQCYSGSGLLPALLYFRSLCYASNKSNGCFVDRGGMEFVSQLKSDTFTHSLSFSLK